MFHQKFQGREDYIESKLNAFVDSFSPALCHAPVAMGGMTKETYSSFKNKSLSIRFKAVVNLYNNLLMARMRESDPMVDCNCLAIGMVRVASYHTSMC